MKKIGSATMIICLLAANFCLADTASDDMTMRINQQLKSESRGQYDSVKDPGRRPAETMRFFGVIAGMTILDFITVAGYNAEILAAAVGPGGMSTLKTLTMSLH